MAKVAKLRIRKEWLWRIWEGIVRYANGNDDQSNQASIRRLRDFRTLVVECMNWIGGTDDDIEECMDIKDGATLTDLEVQYRADIKRVLAWIAAPDRHRALGAKAVDFLSRHGTGIRMHISAYGSGDTDEPLLLQWPDFCDSVVSPLCRFILDQIELHDSEEAKLKDVIPVGKCSRTGCNRFFMIERVGRKQWCGSKCRAKAREGRLSKEEKAAKMRKYRAGRKEQERAWIRRSKTRN